VCILFHVTTGRWRKLHNEELHNLRSTPNIIKVIESRRMKWDEKCIQNKSKKLKGNRSLQRIRHRWEDNITIDLK
jgi:hypothetical protein